MTALLVKELPTKDAQEKALRAMCGPIQQLIGIPLVIKKISCEGDGLFIEKPLWTHFGLSAYKANRHPRRDLLMKKCGDLPLAIINYR